MYLIEDNNDNDEKYILGPDGKFREYDEDTDSWWVVSAAKQHELLQEYEDQEREKENENDALYNQEEADREEEIRNAAIEQEGRISIDDIKNELKGDAFRAKEKKKKKTRRDNLIEDPSFQDIINDINTFIENQVEPETKTRYKYKQSYFKPHPGMRQIDKRIVYPDYKVSQEKITLDKPKPLVMVFLDRSGSFDNPNMIKLSSKIMYMLKDNFYETGKIDLKTYTFGGYSNYPTERSIEDCIKAPASGGTPINGVIYEVARTTSDKLANVVIITDSDSDRNVSESVNVEGAVWLIYINKYTGRLQSFIKGKPTVQYKFNNIDNAISGMETSEETNKSEKSKNKKEKDVKIEVDDFNDWDNE